MEFQKLNAPSLKELFISELENMIISGVCRGKTTDRYVRGRLPQKWNYGHLSFHYEI